MLKEYYVEIKISNHSMVKHYKEKGYDFDYGDIILVNTLDLSKACRKSVVFICDYCGKEFEAILKTRNGNMKKQIIKKDACKECKIKKLEESNLLKYGVKNVFQNEEIKKRHKQTLLKRYGVEHVSQIAGFTEKCIKTSLERYGTEYYTKTDEYSKRCKETWKNKTEEELKTIVEKRRKTLLKRYGEDNPMKIKSIKLKAINTNIEKYGVENVFQNEKIKEKSYNTSIKKYGTKIYSQSKQGRKELSDRWNSFSDEKKEDIINKRKQTSLERYGVTSYTKTEEYLKRVEVTNLEKYGVKHTMQNEGIRKKAYDTFMKNESIPCSIQQKYLYQLLGGKLNYYTGKCFLDIAFPNEKIYIEYDGGGHDLSVKLNKMTQEEFDAKERKRYFALKKEGWKSIRIKSEFDMLPSDENLLELISRAKSVLKDYNWVEIDINENDNVIFRTYDYSLESELKLRRIYREKEVV